MPADHNAAMSNPAVVFTAANQIPLLDVPMPPPSAGQIRVRTRVSVVSNGTESWVWRNEFSWSATPFPCVPGYQRVGVVEAVGTGVTDLQPGQVVMACNGSWDGPIKPFWGSHIAVANSQEVYPLPAGMDEIDAAGLVVAQVGYNAASRIQADVGAWVAVFGDGIIGQCGAQAARARGFKVVLIGRRRERLDLAAKHSADQVVDGREKDLPGAIRMAIGAKTVAGVIDTIQNVETQGRYLPLLENGKGQIVYSGFAPDNAWANMAKLQQQELTAHFVAGWNRPRMEATLALLASGRMRLAPLITHRVSWRDAVAAYEQMRDRSGPLMAIAIDWTGA